MACKYTYKGITYNSKEEFINQVINPQFLGGETEFAEYQRLKKEFSAFSNIRSKLDTKKGNKPFGNLVEYLNEWKDDFNMYKPFTTNISEQRKKDIKEGKAHTYIWKDDFRDYDKKLYEEYLQNLDADRTHHWFENDKFFFTKDQDSSKYYKYPQPAQVTPLTSDYEITKKEFYEEREKHNSKIEEDYETRKEEIKNNILRHPMWDGKIMRLFDNSFVIVHSHEIEEKGDEFLNKIEFEYYDDFPIDRFKELDYRVKVKKEQLSNTIKQQPKTRRILEVQSDLFQKSRGKSLLISEAFGKPGRNTGGQIENEEEFLIGGYYYYNYTGSHEDGSFKEEYSKLTFNDRLNRNWKNKIKISKEEYEKVKKEYETTGYYTKDNKNQFLQLLNKDNNWVTFFIKSIIQDTAKQTITEIQESDVEAKVKELEREGLLEIDCKGKLKAEKGLQTNFTKGGKWKLIKDLKGYPTHKEGGVDLTIGKDGVKVKNGNAEFTAKHGLIIPKN